MIEGDVYSTATLEMAQHAKVKGNVYYKLLEMEVGAEVNGSFIHQSVQASNPKDKSAENNKTTQNTVSDEGNLTAGNN